MTGKDYVPQREKLLRQREQVMQLVRGASNNGSSTELADAFGNVIQDNLQAILQEADHALQEMDAGTYGHCDQCGELIPLERLAVRPQVTRCVKCGHKVEPRPGPHDVTPADANGLPTKKPRRQAM